LHQVGDLFELNVKFRCQKIKGREVWNWSCSYRYDSNIISRKRSSNKAWYGT